MKVSIRQKKMADGERSSLYLEFSSAVTNPNTGGKTRKWGIGAWVYNDSATPAQKAHNKQVMAYAKEREAYALSFLLRDDTSFLRKEDAKASGDRFIDFFWEIVNERTKQGTREAMSSTGRVLEKYDRKGVKLSEVSVEYVRKLREYLLASNSQATACIRFQHIRTALNEAYRRQLIPKKLTDFVRPIKQVESRRSALTKEDIAALNATPCQRSVLKRAALFSAYTGLRISDIKPITRSMLEKRSDGWVYHCTTRKRGTVVLLPLSEKAMSYIDHDLPADAPQFVGLKWVLYSKTRHLDKWLAAAGIKKHVTFHIFRHTFATLALEHTDLYTVSKILGHKDVKTTQIYAKLMISKERAVMDAL